ncbi:MAG: NifU family protein, partial [Myxococcales bacterium]|nr:NifU family protein [Myxococcales bacterium]
MWPSDRERLHKHRVAQGIIPADGEQKAAPPKPAVEVYLKRGCPYTRAAIELLREREIEFIERDVTDDEALQGWLRNVTGRKTTPQIFLHDQSIGGFDELRELDQSGELRARLERGKPEPTPKRPRKLPVLGAHPERSPFEGEVELPEVSASERLEGDALIARVREVLDELRPMVQSDGGDIELL